jgi:beta-glucosidase
MSYVKVGVVSCAALLAYAMAFGQSGDFTNRGRVVTSGGAPIPRATVTYMLIAKRLSWDFSLNDGTFGVGGVSVIPPATLTLAAKGPVTIDIFDVSGKMVGTASGANIDKGEYSLEPVCANLSKAMYILKIKVGDKVTCQKMLNTGVYSGSVAYTLSSVKTPLVMAKKVAKLAAIDTVRVGKTGYTPVFIPVTTYTDNVGDVILTPIDIEGQVNAKFSQMTQLQKCAQLAMVETADANASAAASNSIGSVFGGGGALSGSSAAACATMINGYQTAMMGTTLKIPILAAYDFVHGASAVPGAVITPHNMGLGAIQDTLLIQKVFRMQALEVRGSGCAWGFGPCIAVIRNDRWGRAYEGFCETPALTQIMAKHSVLGIQLTDLSCPMTYAACAKHFAGDGNTVNGANPGTTECPDATARAINLPGYSTAVGEGVATIMPSFSAWCGGTPMHQYQTLLMNWLKLGQDGGPSFTGFVVGDWEAHNPLNTCLNAGLDVPMPPGAGLGIITSINNLYGSLGARIDDACKRVLRIKYRMNIFSPTQYVSNPALTALVGCAAHRDVARAAVRASLVLLKNNSVGGVPVLPMPKNANVAIWGTGGDNIGIQCGGWTVSWQGSVGTPTSGGTTIRAGMQALTTGTVSYVASPSGAGSSVYVVAILSEDPYAETAFPNVAITGNKASGTNAAVITQIAAAHTAGKKVIGILMAGRPLNISAILPNCDAFIWASLPGTEGRGIGEMLYGDQGYTFTGKLPVTWPKTDTDEPINDGDGNPGLFAYGFGLTD